MPGCHGYRGGVGASAATAGQDDDQPRHGGGPACHLGYAPAGLPWAL